MRRRWLPARRENTAGLSPWIIDISKLHEELDKWFENVASSVFGGSKELANIASPRIDVYEKDDNIIIEAEVPGIDPESLDVRIYPDRVRIKAERKQENKAESDNYYYCERFYGTFVREIPLPVEIDVENAKATYKHGVLTLELPKIKEEKEEGKKLDINMED